MGYPRVVLAGTNSGVGKTTLTMGLIAALKKRGLTIQPFKVGPDYIDPSYHTRVSGRYCRNLDAWMLAKDAVLELFERQAKLSDISIIEGVMGLYDGLKNKETGSSAHLAKMLKSPVILVMDAGSMSRSAGAVVLGYKEFDRGVDLRGVIVNNIGSRAHYDSIKTTIEKRTGLPVLGFLPKDKVLVLPERHLGLIPAGERGVLDSFIEKLSGLIEKTIDIDRVIKISRQAEAFPRFTKKLFGGSQRAERVTIAIAKDEAFNFYYQDNLDILVDRGANLVEFKPLGDKRLPEGADGLYIGGGFPELFAGKLSRNISLKNDILKKAKGGMPIYAECGGLMYLAKEIIDFENKAYPMVGIFDASIKMALRLRALGYVTVEALKDNLLCDKGRDIKAHVFHWSYLDKSGGKEKYAYRVKKDKDNITSDGLVKWNTLASYAHLHFGSDPELAGKFIEHCRASRHCDPAHSRTGGGRSNLRKRGDR